jgi:hypothetical protein
MVRTFLLTALLSLGVTIGQTTSTDQRIVLDDLKKALADPEIAEVHELTDAIQKYGIQFDLGTEELGAILDAAAKGKRDSNETASLILTCFRVCQSCREHLLEPMSLEESLTFLKWRFAPAAIAQEVRVRGIKDLEISEGTADVLRAAGANEELVSLIVPDDKIPTIPLAGDYKPFEPKHAEDYDPSAIEGWLRVNTELPAKSQSEFVFKHNALFVKAISGDAPKTIDAYFNKPTPRNAAPELIDFVCGLENPPFRCDQEPTEKHGLKDTVRRSGNKNNKTSVPLIKASYIPPASGDRSGFSILVANPQPEPRKYSFYLRWQVLASPKPAPAPIPKPNRKP